MTILVAPLRTAMVLTVVAGGRAVRSIPPAMSTESAYKCLCGISGSITAHGRKYSRETNAATRTRDHTLYTIQQYNIYYTAPNVLLGVGWTAAEVTGVTGQTRRDDRAVHRVRTDCTRSARWPRSRRANPPTTYTRHRDPRRRRRRFVVVIVFSLLLLLLHSETRATRNILYDRYNTTRYVWNLLGGSRYYNILLPLGTCIHIKESVPILFLLLW